MDSWTEYFRGIDQRLDALRPDRSGRNDKDWREPVYGWARNHIPDESNLIRKFAEREVDRREAVATKRGNKLLRSWARGQAALFWKDLGPLPVVVAKVRIRLDAVTPDDIDDAARELEEAGKAVYDEVVLLGLALRDLGRAARRKGLATVALLGDLDPRLPAGEVAPFDEEDEDDADPDVD